VNSPTFEQQVTMRCNAGAMRTSKENGMSLDKELELLKQVPMFSNIADSNLKLLAFVCERRCYAGGEVLFKQGGEGDFAYVIIERHVNVTVDSPSGPIVVATLKEKQIVGEIAILCDVPRTVTVRAATEVDALRVTKDLFIKLSGEFLQVAVEVMREMSHRLQATTSQLTESVSST